MECKYILSNRPYHMLVADVGKHEAQSFSRRTSPVVLETTLSAAACYQGVY